LDGAPLARVFLDECFRTRRQRAERVGGRRPCGAWINLRLRGGATRTLSWTTRRLLTQGDDRRVDVTEGTRLTASMTSLSRAVASVPELGILLASMTLAGCGGVVTAKPSAGAKPAATSRPTTTSDTPQTGSDNSGGGS